MWLRQKPEGAMGVPWRWWLVVSPMGSCSAPSLWPCFEGCVVFRRLGFDWQRWPLRPLMHILTWFQPSFLCFLVRYDMNSHCLTFLSPHRASSASMPYTGMGCTLSETVGKTNPTLPSCVVWMLGHRGVKLNYHPGTIGKGQTDQARE